ENAPVGFAFFDQDLRFLRVNGRIAWLHGMAAEEYIGASLHEIDPRVAEQVEPLLQRVLATGGPVMGAEFDRVPPGLQEARHIVASFYPITTREGGLFAIGAVVADVTES